MSRNRDLANIISTGVPNSLITLDAAEIPNLDAGKITSGTFSPTLKKPIGIGFILKDKLNYYEEILIDNKRKKFKAKISSLPFIRS